MRIAVLGGGHGGYAAAADLAEQGHAVRLWRRDAQALASIGAQGGIWLKDHRGRRLVALDKTTGDIGAAIHEAELILIPAPAFAQVDIARALAPHLKDGQVVFLPPGSFGSTAMAAELRRTGSKAQALFAETGTLPYLARKHGPAEIAITTRATRLPTGVFPARAASQALDAIAQAYPAVEPAGDALSGALMNAGPIIHPPLILMNAGPLEHSKSFDIHNEGTQPAIRRVTDALDAERMALREALGYAAPHFPLSDHYTSDRWMYGNAHDKLVDSGDWREPVDLKTHRYMTEDIAYGLAFLASVAEWASVPTPIADGLLALGSTVAGVDFRKGPRTLAALGLDGLDRLALQNLLARGFND